VAVAKKTNQSSPACSVVLN